MKTLLAVAAVLFLSGCQGLYDNKKYVVGAKHEALAQCVEARSKGYDSKMVIAKNEYEMTAWCEVDGTPVCRLGLPRRLFTNPRWPLPMYKATKRGTPKELGLYGDKGEPATRYPLLFTSKQRRLIGHYEACLAIYGNANIATNGSVHWLEVVVDGKRYAETTRQGHLDHYDKAVSKGCTVLWRGTLEEYEALGANDTRTDAEIAKNRAEVHEQIKNIPGTYWTSK